MTRVLWLILCVAQEEREPHLGYLYPAGGQQGTVVQLFAGGQLLNGIQGVLVSGDGVRARIVRYMGRFVMLNGEQRKELWKRLEELKSGKKPTPSKDEDKLQKHPLFKDLDRLSPLEVEFLVNEFIKFDTKRQLNPQISETALIEIAIDPNAAPGDRELRLRSPLGLTNPMCFQVGRVPELREPEPYNVEAAPGAPVDLPVTFNGQIRPGDVDRFRFRAKVGQRLVIQANARRLIPFLADAVPGWFQATLALYDSKGKELAFDDDYRFDPDPVLFFQTPAAGVYELEIRDSLYRGRQDFVYRVTVGEEPFIKSVFPLGGKVGEETVAVLDGWNLAETSLKLDTRPGDDPYRERNGVTYAVDTLPEGFEVEPNDTPHEAQRIDLPRIVNGRIARPGDADVFQFQGKAGEEFVAEVVARRLRSPLDSLVRLIDSSGRVVAWNDDLEHKEGDLRTDMGAITHHADSYLRVQLPQNGVYFVQLTDTQQQGGEAYGYRLRLGAPRPGFSLRMTPSTLNVRSGVATPITVYALRQDGFDGAIDLSLKDAPPGFKLQGATIPAGRDRIRMTLTTSKPPETPISLHLEGRADVGDRPIAREAVPCDDLMQAFLWRHLVPCRDLVVAGVGRAWRIASPERVGKGPVRIPAGGTVEVEIKTAARAKLEEFQFLLEDPPKGVTLQDVAPSRDGLKLVLKADGQAAEVGGAGNLIVEVYTVRAGPSKDGKTQPMGKRFFVGVLPAIPFRIVK